MFDELKDVKCFKNNKFQEPYVKYFKEIKHLKSLRKAGTHLQHKRTSTMELF